MHADCKVDDRHASLVSPRERPLAQSFVSSRGSGKYPPQDRFERIHVLKKFEFMAFRSDKWHACFALIFELITFNLSLCISNPLRLTLELTVFGDAELQIIWKVRMKLMPMQC
ncbi:hypothetical protein Zmor_021759 [Zophobas morio]|uniref:Uncharacterized protein n=1 Tax=Zophobas morio TaxID=2755281 RepID=A0AA38MB75_9CUCU|nr:hypothetical protein Zmor_021759 [Zophobas morio]